jgi:outer membrane protein assembly factor BamD
MAGCGGATIPPILTPADRLSVGKQLADEGSCPSAVELFKSYIATSAGSADVDQAIYFLAECYTKMKDHTSAAIEFERLVRDYPESDSAAAASFRLGDALFGQTRPIDFDQEYTVRAIRQWDGYLRAFPGHWRNAEAETRVMDARTRLAQKAIDTGDLYLRLRHIGPARVYFRMVVDEYGDTPLAGEGLFGLARCDVMAGDRDRAIERFREVEERFAGMPVAERAAHERRGLEH